MSIVVVGAYGFSNLGDEAMLNIVLRSLNDIYPDEEKFVSCVNRDQVSVLHNVKTLSSISPASMIRNFVKLRFGECIKLLKIYRKMSVLVYGGGSLFNDAKGIKNISVILSTVLMARFFRSSVVLWGVGIGPLHSSAGASIIRKILKLSDVVIVRDDKSQALANQLCPQVEVKRGVDLLFNVSDYNKITPHKRKANNECINIGVSLRPYPALSGINYEAIDKSIILAMSLALTTISGDKRIKIYGLVYSEGGDRRNDIGMLNKLKSAMDASVFGEDIGGFSTNKGKTIEYIVSNMLDDISSLDIVIGERFHSIVMAAVVGTPFVAISYDQKISELAKAMGMTDYCIDIGNEINVKEFANSIKEAIEKIIINYDPVKGKLVEELNHVRCVAAEDKIYIANNLS